VSASSRNPRKLKVVDRRWFTDDGQLREDRPQTQSVVKQQPAAGGQPASSPEETPEKAQSSTSQGFLELIGVLAQQAEVLIAGAPGVPRQIDQGLRMIDYLVTLETKTRGNLSGEESQVLSNILFQLRALSSRVAR
jgi:hypothetical protein